MPTTQTVSDSPSAATGRQPDQSGHDAAAEGEEQSRPGTLANPENSPRVIGDRPHEQQEISEEDQLAPDDPSQSSEVQRRRVRTRLSVAGSVLAFIAAAFALYFGRAILLPIVFALLMTVTLRPVVRYASRRRIPEGLTAGLLIAGLVFVGAYLLILLATPAQEWTSDFPARMDEVGHKLDGFRERFRHVTEVSEQLEDITKGKSDEQPAAGEEGTNDPVSTGRAAPEQPEDDDAEVEEPVPVEVQPSRLSTGLTAISSVGGFTASLVIALALAFFLLSQGDVLLNNFLHTLPTMREKRNIVELIYEVERGISKYLLTVTVINCGLGVAIGTAMWLLGMPNPVLWGAMATLFNFVPYLGALAGVVVVFVVAILSFDTLLYASLVPLVYFSLTAIEGNLVTPSILGRTMQLSPIMVLVSLVFWGWMWGVGGALLAVPILAVMKIGFDRFERTRAVGTLLGGESGITR